MIGLRVQQCVVACAVWWLTACAATPAVTRDQDSFERASAQELYAWAERLAERGDDVRAEQYAVLAVSRGVPMTQALPLLLRVCLRASRVTAAVAHVEPHLRVHPENYRLRHLLASMYLALDQAQDAERELRRVLLDAPGYGPALASLQQLQRSEP